MADESRGGYIETEEGRAVIPEWQNSDGRRGVLVVTHPRSGTHLTMDLLRRNVPALASRKLPLAPLDSMYVALDTLFLKSASHSSVARARHGLIRHRIPILKSHWMSPDFGEIQEAYPEIAHWLRTSVKIIYVVRDPKKVMASTFLFESGFDRSVSQTDRHAWLVRKAAYWVAHVSGWNRRSNVLTLRFEDIIAGPVSVVHEAGKFLGLDVRLSEPVLPPRLKSIWAARLARLRMQPSTTEILNAEGRQELRTLFSSAAVQEFEDTVAPVCAEFGYNREG